MILSMVQVLVSGQALVSDQDSASLLAWDTVGEDLILEVAWDFMILSGVPDLATGLDSAVSTVVDWAITLL